MTDADALARLEALIQTQESAAVPWVPVTDYSAAARDVVERPHANLIVSTFQPSMVYDVGCGPGHLVRLLEAKGVAVVGFDKDAQGDAVSYDVASTLATRVKADLVICREVLEHLTVKEIARAVRNLCGLSSRYVYVTTRFNLAPTHLLDVMTSDDLDPTHISMTNQHFLRMLFVLEGFKRRADLEQMMDWRQYGRVLVYERA